MDKIFVFGHKKPDTDSVTSSIALSYLKNQLGYETEPRVLGDINNESKFVLKYFDVKQPKILNDVKLQIKDINYQKENLVFKNESIYHSFFHMLKNKATTLPIVDEKKKLVGIVSMKSIAEEQIAGDLANIETSYQNIVSILNGEEILKFDEEIKGKSLIASYRSTTFMENIDINHESILIVGDRHSIIEHAVMNGAKLIIVTGNGIIKENHLVIAKQNHVNVIRTSMDTFSVAKIIGLSNYVSTITSYDSVIAINENDYMNDLIDLSKKHRYSNYPVVSHNGTCLGLFRLADMNDKQQKKVILVDHNLPEQSVDGLDEAEIIEIIDHHNIGTIGTSKPINFRNMPVGSTNTILYLLYRENHIDIPKQIAGVMVSGIISDTLLMKSPTTTEIDRIAIEELSKIAEINTTEYAYEMFKAGSSIEGMTEEQILYSDFKNFKIDNSKLGIGQIFTLNIDEIKKDETNFIDLIERVAANNGYSVVALFVTDIIKNGSYLYYNQKAADILKDAFYLEEIEQGIYLDGIISRKKQIIPNIMRIMD
ncbi:MAG: putative manganese-dependent inorganic diphosphatase [Firmicutes bacterium]|nr:putative manganese-dependent inorganic diphosphatase [Bacillota bacterium]